MNTEKLSVELVISNTGPFRSNYQAPPSEQFNVPKKIRIIQARLQYLAPNYSLPSNLSIEVKRVSDGYYKTFGDVPYYGIMLADAMKKNLQIISVNDKKLEAPACAFKTGIEVDYPNEGDAVTLTIEFQLNP